MEGQVFKRRLKEAYDNVFSTGETSQLDLDIVINDIAKQTHLFTRIKGDLERSEGHRDIGLHINGFIKLPMEHFVELDKKIEHINKDTKRSL